MRTAIMFGMLVLVHTRRAEADFWCFTASEQNARATTCYNDADACADARQFTRDRGYGTTTCVSQRYAWCYDVARTDTGATVAQCGPAIAACSQLKRARMHDNRITNEYADFTECHRVDGEASAPAQRASPLPLPTWWCTAMVQASAPCFATSDACVAAIITRVNSADDARNSCRATTEVHCFHWHDASHCYPTDGDCAASARATGAPEPPQCLQP